MNTNILVVGDYESVIIYKTLNCDIVCISKDENFDSVINQVKNKEYKIIFVVENFYAQLKKKFLDNKLKILNKETALIPIIGIGSVLKKYETNVAKQKYQELSRIATGLKLNTDE